MNNEHGYWLYANGKSFWGVDIGCPGQPGNSGLAITREIHESSDVDLKIKEWQRLFESKKKAEADAAAKAKK